MAPLSLSLPDGMRVKFFGSSRNNNSVEKYLMRNAQFGLDAVSATPESVAGEVAGERIKQLFLQNSSSVEATAASEEGADLPVLVAGDADLAQKGKRKRQKGVTGKLTAQPRAKTVSAKKRRKLKTCVNNITRRWQEVWAAKYAWTEGVFDRQGEVVGVLCTTCTSIDGHRKVMVPKDDNLQKHEGKRTCVQEGVLLPEMKVGNLYTKLDCKHFQNCKVWASRKQTGTVADQLVGALVGENKRKGVQFATLFDLLCHGHPMCDYERTKSLLEHLKVKNVPKKHWLEISGWEMSEHLHASVLSTITSAVQKEAFIAISADEVIAVDNTSWIGVHVYALRDWEREPHLLHLSLVGEDGGADNLTNVIMGALFAEGGLTHEEIACKVACFSADGVSTFQGHKPGVTTQIREKWSSFLISIHCTSHRVNLAVQTLLNFPMVSRLETMLASIYVYFRRSNKKHAELQKLANLMETKGNKMLRNVTTRWISMRSPAMRVLDNYRTLIVKMRQDMAPILGEKVAAGATDNFKTLVDLEILLSLSVIQPLLSCVHVLIKFSQARDVFICDFLQSVNVCQVELASKYIDPVTSWSQTDFERCIREKRT